MRRKNLQSVRAMLAWHMGDRASCPLGQAAQEFDKWLLELSPEAAEAVFQHSSELVHVLESGAAEDDDIRAELDAALAIVVLGGGGE